MYLRGSEDQPRRASRHSWCPADVLRSSVVLGVTLLWSAGTTLRADTVLLENGDRLTGEVQKLAEKKLAFKTTYAGTVQIDWNEVEQLSTKEPFDVEMETGMRYRGTLQEADEGIDVVAEDTTVTVNPIQLVAMTSVTDQKPPGFFDTLQGDVDAGLTLNRGNSRLTQNSLGVKTEYRREKYRVSGGFTSAPQPAGGLRVNETSDR